MRSRYFHWFSNSNHLLTRTKKETGTLRLTPPCSVKERTLPAQTSAGFLFAHCVGGETPRRLAPSRWGLLTPTDIGNNMADNLYNRRRSMYLERLGGMCVRCGSKDQLHFDHINPYTKRFGISECMTYRVETVLPEVDKCQLLCETCHRTKTRVERSNYLHGTYYGFMERRCDCDPCLGRKREWMARPESERRKPVQLLFVRRG